jgi:8-oxo-dGTP pyrophosphatase MutT (NUDIX family)
MTDLDGWLDRLSSVLNPIDSPLSDLAVRGFRPPSSDWQWRPAAVLIAISDQPQPGVILTVRPAGMAQHAGQVALPGGGREGDEAFPLATALRESREEIGLEATLVRPLGLLDHFDTISAYRVTPVVGLLAPEVRLSPCPREVHALFSVPLARVLDLASYRRHLIRRQGQQWDFWSMKAEGCWPVWGATAAMLRELALRYSGTLGR